MMRKSIPRAGGPPRRRAAAVALQFRILDTDSCAMQSSPARRALAPSAWHGSGMSLSRAAGVVYLAWAASALAQDADSTAARSVAATCASCHGTNGASVSVLPSLAGLPRDEIVAKMREFKAGTRQGTLMPQIASGYTDSQIDAAARWFAAQPLPRR